MALTVLDAISGVRRDRCSHLVRIHLIWIRKYTIFHHLYCCDLIN